ncbi:MAG: diversity-generating retroelement protein Avd [Chloroflexia bacterium]|nr:diversity-generating retroelement protein Avd [Chloroflexia bacterium]
MKESPIFSRTYDLLRWLIPTTIKFPRQQRFVLAEALQRTALRFQERLIEAARGPEPLAALRQADVDLAKLRFYLRLGQDMELLSLGQYEHVARMVEEVGRLLGGWIRSVGGVEKPGKSN